MKKATRRSCAERSRLQDHLDGELGAAESRAFESHLAGCAECARELEAYERLFARIDRLPLAEAPSGMTERILARVVPDLARRRWLRTFGWAYAASLAACVVATTVAISLPGARALGGAFSTEVSRLAVHSGVLAVNGFAFVVLGLANGWGAVLEVAGRIAPFPRAFATVLADPAIALAVTAAAVFCVLLLAVLHGRGRGSTRRVDPFGVLGV